MLVRLLISCLVILWCLGAAEAHKIQLRQESATGFPAPTDPQGLSYAELDTNFLALAAGALSRSAVQSLTAGSQISCNNQALIPIIGSGGAVTLTSNPQILSPTDLPVTKFCILEGTSATNTVTLVDGNGLDLPGATSLTITLNTLVLLVYNGTDWIGFSSGGGGLNSGTTFPASPNSYDVFLITDDSTTGACDSDVGTAVTLCYWDPVAMGWTPVGGGGGGGAGTLDQAFDGGKSIDGANSHPNAVRIGNGTWFHDRYVDSANVAYDRVCNAAQSTCITKGIKTEVSSDLLFVNENSTTCWSVDSVTGALAENAAGTCAVSITTSQPIQGSRLNLGGTTCLSVSSDRIYHDTDCDGVKDAGEEFVDTTTAGSLTAPNIRTSSPYSLQSSDCGGEVWANTVNLEIDLLADMTGCKVCFFAQTAHTITVDPNGTDTLIAHGLTLAAGDAVQVAAAVGANVCVSGASSSLIAIYPGSGALADVN